MKIRTVLANVAVKEGGSRSVIANLHVKQPSGATMRLPVTFVFIASGNKGDDSSARFFVSRVVKSRNSR